MTAYLIFIREDSIADPAAYAEYQGHNRNNPSSIPAKPLVVYGKTEALEGEAPDGMVVLEFPDMATARAWYKSPEYQSGIPLRQKAADYRAILVEGWAP